MNSSDIRLVVQIRGKHIAHIERVSLGSRGLKVGRAWDSDIIIQDKFVDDTQLSLSLSELGSLAVEDLGSTNGSLLSGQPLNGQAQDYLWGQEIRVGDTSLRIYNMDSQVEQTANRSSWHSLQKYLESSQALVVITFMAVLISTLSEWAFSSVPMSTPDLLVGFVTTAVSILVLTLLFGSIGKLVQGQSNMRAHLGLVGLVIIAAILFSNLLGIVLFNLQSPSTAQWLGLVLYGSLFLIYCFGFLTYTTHLSSRAKWICSLLLVAGTVAAIKSDGFLKEPHELWSDRSNSEQTTLPPALLFREPVSLNDYFDETNRLFDRVLKQD